MGDQIKVVDETNLDKVWEAVANRVKMVTGEVDLTKDGTLQKQINDLKSGQSSGLTIADDTTGTNYKIGINNGMLYYEEVV